MAHVFLAYAHADRAFAAALVTVIQEQTGMLVWWDERLVPSEHWNEKVKNAIAECDRFVVLLSRASLASDFVKSEIADAHDLKKPIYGVLLESIPELELPHPLRLYQHVT